VALERIYIKLSNRLEALEARRPAAGAPGRGIAKAVISESGHLMLAWTDGTLEDIGNIRLEAEAPAAAAAITAARVTPAGELELHMSDGKVLNAGRVVGTDGTPGATIQDARVTDEGRLEIMMTDRRRIDAGVVMPSPPEKLTEEELQAALAKIAPSIAAELEGKIEARLARKSRSDRAKAAAKKDPPA
jgi:hypothetical protein